MPRLAHRRCRSVALMGNRSGALAGAVRALFAMRPKRRPSTLSDESHGRVNHPVRSFTRTCRHARAGRQSLGPSVAAARETGTITVDILDIHDTTTRRSIPAEFAKCKANSGPNRVVWIVPSRHPVHPRTAPSRPRRPPTIQEAVTGRYIERPDFARLDFRRLALACRPPPTCGEAAPEFGSTHLGGQRPPATPFPGATG
jgi:hypothetical protein